MDSPSVSQFLRRPPNNGKFESICKLCFHTVAKVESEADLETAEKDHVCDPWTRSPEWHRAIREFFGP